MPVTEETIDTVMVRLSMHYRPSLATPAEIAAVGIEYGRCLERMHWCTDDIFLEAIDWVIDNADTKGFLPPWSTIRSKCADLYKARVARGEADKHLAKLRGPLLGDTSADPQVETIGRLRLGVQTISRLNKETGAWEEVQRLGNGR